MKKSLKDAVKAIKKDIGSIKNKTLVFCQKQQKTKKIFRGENKMKNLTTLSTEAKEIINDLFEKGHTPRGIKNAMEDGAFLESARISQEIAEEIHNLLSEPFLLELHRNALDFCSDRLSKEQIEYCEDETK